MSDFQSMNYLMNSVKVTIHKVHGLDNLTAKSQKNSKNRVAPETTSLVYPIDGDPAHNEAMMVIHRAKSNSKWTIYIDPTKHLVLI